jgi:hypothetical protein
MSAGLTDQDARERFSVRFYIIAMLFLIFDVETVFLLPWAIGFDRLACVWPRRDVDFCGNTGGWLLLRVAQGCAQLGLSQIRSRSHMSLELNQNEGGGFITSKVDWVINWGRSSALWPMTFWTRLLCH